MRSLKFIAAALLPVINSAYAGTPFGNDVVIVTKTRTITFCPVMDWVTCDMNSYGPTSSITSGLPSTSSSTTTTTTSGTTSSTSSTSSIIGGDPSTRTTTSNPDGTTVTTTSSSVITSTISSSVITSTISGSIVTSTISSVITTTGPSSTITTTSGTSTITSTSSGPVIISTISSSVVTSTISSSIVTSTISSSVITSTISSVIISTSTSSDPGYHNGTTSTTGTSSTITTAGNGTTTSGISSTITTTGNGTVTTGISSTSISTSSGFPNSTTTTACFNSTRTAAPFSFDQGFLNNCNRPGARDQWCGGKNIQSDTDVEYSTGQTREYTLTITLGTSNGDDDVSISSFLVNGKTPGDPIVANWGDDVVVTVINAMDPSTGPVNATTIHWHGILQRGTNDQDGVPGVTECGIAPGSSRTYKWHASTYGTTWYHSHLLSQYGGGIRGPIIIHGPASSDYDLDMGPMMITEKFTDSVFNLAAFYNTQHGVQVASNYLINGMNLNRLNPNIGQAATFIVKAGKKHLFRIINASAQSGYAVHFDQHNMTVISADLVQITPYVTDNLYINPGQRYNVIVTADQPPAAYWIRAITQIGCGTPNANAGLGTSNAIMEYEGSCYTTPNSSYLLDTSQTCKDELLTNLVPVVPKGAGSSSLFQASAQNMAGGTNGVGLYNGTQINRWMFGSPTPFNGTANSTADSTISVTFDQPTLQMLPTVGNFGSKIYGNTVFYNEANKWIYWVIQNGFITSHPMHLHGHDFAVLGQAYGQVFTADMTSSLNFNNPMRRDTVLLYGNGGVGAPGTVIPPKTPGYTVIGFQTDNPGAWVMHCHIIWHADLGMGIQVVERPNDMPDYYTGNTQFQNECSALDSYQNGGSDRVKPDYESGLKRRHLEEHKFHGYSHGHAVRHE